MRKHNPARWWHRAATAGCARTQQMASRPHAGVSAVETAIVVPALLLMLFGIVQTGLYFHARDLASSAAQVAAQRARTVDGTSGAGQAAAVQYVKDTGGGVLLSPVVAVSKTATTVRVVVTGTTPALVPGLPMPAIVATVAAPVERLTP